MSGATGGEAARLPTPMRAAWAGWPSPRRWALLAAVVVVAHLATVWALPRLAMARLAAGASAAERQGETFPPATDHTQRRVVMPSPDLLYAACAIDLRRGARLRVHADPRAAGHRGYWSIALYASNSDNFFVLNDRAVGDGAATFTVVAEDDAAAHAAAAGQGPGAPVTVASPSTRGLLLMRVLVGNPVSDAAIADAARRTLRCETLAPG